MAKIHLSKKRHGKRSSNGDEACWSRSYVHVNAFDGVDQASPILDSDNVNNNTPGTSVSTKAMVMAANDMPIYSAFYQDRSSTMSVTNFTEDMYDTKTSGGNSW